MIHLPTAAGGRVQHLVRGGAVVERGTVLVRVEPDEGPPEEIAAPIDGQVVNQRLAGTQAPRYAMVVGLRRIVLATCSGRLRWIATLGPVGVTTLMALVDSEGAVRPHRAGGSGFVGERFASPGDRVSRGDPLVEIRSEELA